MKTQTRTQTLKDAAASLPTSVERAPLPKDIARAIALLEKHGYGITAPPAPEPVSAVTIDWEERVKECREALERATRLETDADNLCMMTPLDDRDLQRYRDEAIKAGHRVAQAEADLEEALKDRRILGAAS